MIDAPLAAARLVPTQKRSRERFEVILETAEQILLEKGPDAFRMSDIVARAGVPHGSLYQYFPDKAAVIATLAGRLNEAGRDCVAAELATIAAPADLGPALQRITDGFFAMYQDIPAMRVIWQATQADPALQRLDAEESALLAGLLAARLVALMDAPRAWVETFARLQITLIGAVVRDAISMPEGEAQALLAQFRRSLDSDRLLDLLHP